MCISHLLYECFTASNELLPSSAFFATLIPALVLQFYTFLHVFLWCFLWRSFSSCRSHLVIIKLKPGCTAALITVSPHRGARVQASYAPGEQELLKHLLLHLSHGSLKDRSCNMLGDDSVPAVLHGVQASKIASKWKKMLAECLPYLISASLHTASYIWNRSASTSTCGTFWRWMSTCKQSRPDPTEHGVRTPFCWDSSQQKPEGPHTSFIDWQVHFWLYQ